ncbi:hypothetical protein JMN32_04130 [Fulvivirga sp. 29W222]|uniref:Coiled coil domain-containing protein n=1 Tax=Fulvivirga marina TaxID=2494733 RepID=A0A937FYY4_9BACT|nr:hypothetical protein [Fulvivirga marina]MBL6445481.1 hypothetical protein [Fulvivirga marina]
MEDQSQGKAEHLLKDIGKKIDELIADLKVAKDQAKIDYADRIEELKRNAETLKGEFKSFKETHKDSWDEAEKSLEKAGQELKNAFEAIFKKTGKKA